MLNLSATDSAVERGNSRDDKLVLPHIVRKVFLGLVVKVSECDGNLDLLVGMLAVKILLIQLAQIGR